MIWPLIDPINASTKSSSKLTVATPPANVHTPWNVGGRPEETTHPAIADVWRLYEATTLPRALVSMQTRRRESLRRTYCFVILSNGSSSVLPEQIVYSFIGSFIV